MNQQKVHSMNQQKVHSMNQQITEEQLAQLRALLDTLVAADAGPRTYTILIDAPKISNLPMVLRLNP